MLSEVFGAVFSKQGIRATLWLALLALLFFLAGAAIVLPWLLANGFPFARVRPLAATHTPLAVASLIGVAAALFLLASYAHTALIDLARRLRAGEPPRIEEALRRKKQKTLSYAGGLLLFTLIQGVAVAILAATIAAFVPGAGLSAPGGPGPSATPAGPTRIPVLQGAPFDFGTSGSQAVPTTPPALIGALLLGVVLLIVWVAYFTVRLTFFRYAVAVDGERAVASLKTSWRLTRGKWWSLFGTFLLLGLVLAILGLVASFAVALPFSLLSGGGSVLGILIFGLAFAVAFQVLWYLFGVPALFYGGLVAYQELKRLAPPAASAAPPPP